MWNLPEKGELESHREKTYIDDIIHKSHIERKLASSNNLASLKSSITFWHSAYYPIYILGFYSFRLHLYRYSTHIYIRLKMHQKRIPKHFSYSCYSINP